MGASGLWHECISDMAWIAGIIVGAYSLYMWKGQIIDGGERLAMTFLTILALGGLGIFELIT